jgi:isocitrate dehydrogenase
MKKIKMQNPIVEIDGDEMTRLIWRWVKDKLILPYVDLKTDYYDLHIKNRDETDDQVTTDAANAIKRYKVGVKCATITANDERVIEYSLKKTWQSPNGTIRKILNGTVFRKPIIFDSIKPFVAKWRNPIIIARHAYGDVYASIGVETKAGTKAELVLTDSNNKETRETLFEFEEGGIVMAEYNLDSSIAQFAETCFKYALEEKLDLMFSAKDTIAKVYDNRFKNIFEDLYLKKYRKMFEQANIKYIYTLIDDAVARVIKSEGNILWACKNYDGDVMSDMVASGFGSLALMTSVLVSPEGNYEYEAAHGTVKNHYYKHLKGEVTSTNPIAIIYAWTGALRKRGQLDANTELVELAEKIELATSKTINTGIITKDLFEISNVVKKKWVTSEEIIDAIASNLAYNI